jgi:hypothetical protein
MLIKDNDLDNGERLSELMHNAMLMNTHKNKKFLTFLYRKKKFNFSGGTYSMKALNDFFKLLDLFEAKYKDLYDLGFQYNGHAFSPYFKVLYPEFTITNSHGNTHVIRDLVVVHRVAYNRENGGHIYTVHPQGGRFSKTVLETASNYQQSHLGSHSGWKNNPFEVTSFCVGGDTDVSRMIAEFEVEMDWDRYELYLFCIDSMVTWESLEGVPYMKIANIKNSLNNRVTTVNVNALNAILREIQSKEIPLDVDFYVENGFFRIRPNERANEFIKQIALKVLAFSNYKTVLVSRVPNTFNEFLQMRAESTPSNVIKVEATTHYTIFRGRKVFAKIIKEDKRVNEPVPLEEYIVYPKFLKDVLSQLESRIYSKAVTKSGIKIHNSLSNANRSVSSDSVPVQEYF